MSFDPIAVGAIGGSGTRVVSQILQSVGYFFGDLQSKANDTLWAALMVGNADMLTVSDAYFQERLRYLITALSDRPRDGLSAERLQVLFEEYRPNMPAHRADEAFENIGDWLFHRPPNTRPWGWKAPTTHFFAERILESFPDIKYLHVIRDPYDLALSKNQRQFEKWSNALYDLSGYDDDNQRLKFWLETTDKIATVQTRFPARVRILKLEDLCRDPKREVSALFDYLNVDVNQKTFDAAVAMVQTPASIGRGEQGAFGKWDIDLHARATDWGY